MTRWCPNCRAGWPDERSTCLACLAQLVDDPDTTVTCHHCDLVWPASKQSCPQCLAELQPDPQAAALGLTDLLASGRRLPRPPDVAAFASGPDCTLLRSSAESALLYAGPLDWMEAFVRSAGNAAATPLACCDVDGTVLFRLVAAASPHGALETQDPDGTPLSTFVPHENEVEVRDQAGATVAQLQSALGGWQVMATGEHHVADLLVTEVLLGTTHTDDQWELRVHHDLPVGRLAAIALPLAGKILLGWAHPHPIPASVTSETVT